MTGEVIERFTHLFRGRCDIRGDWKGGAIREPLTVDHWARHLTSSDQADWMGVYPAGAELCSWGCIDIDGGDFPATYTEGGNRFDARGHPDYDRKTPVWHDWNAMLELAEDLVKVLSVKQIDGHIEHTRNGYHVWVFPEDTFVEARIMRRALMAACTAIGYNPNEVNPKSERLEGVKVGNYVRLPYPGALAPDTKLDVVERVFIFERQPLTIGEFVDWAGTTTTAALEECSRLWAPKTVKHAVNLAAGMEAEPLLRRLTALGYTIWRDGPLPGSDRSSTLAHLSHICNESGLLPDEAFVVVRSADERHGRKFADREDGNDRIAEMIERAYAT